jgi:hypothetical protein
MAAASQIAQPQIVDLYAEHLAIPHATTFGAGLAADLIFTGFDELPAEEPGVDGPGPRSDHRQSCAQRR